ncbi:MAG: glycosyltransferase family 2 protein [Candidatus Moraniibacteriota bacterium]
MKLSIITPSYNQGKFIRDTFNSILNQDINFKLEYILVDAVSKDETSKIVEEFSPKFKTRGIDFIYICEKDSGQSDAINKGFRLATGDIITYLNSDDFYEPNSLQEVIEYFDNNPKIKWAYGGWNLVTKNSMIFRILSPQKYSKDTLLNYCNIGQPSCFFRKELLNEVGMLDENLHLAMDYDLWLRFASKYDAGIIGKIISNMRYYSEAKSSAKATAQLLETLRIGKKHTKLFSFRRFAQYFFYLRGLIAIMLKVSKIQRNIS